MRQLPSTPRRRKDLLADEVHEYSENELDRLFRVSGTLLHALGRAGYITAATGEVPTGYSFQDLLTLRTASALKAANIAESKIIDAIGNIRNSLTPGSVLTALALGSRDSTRRKGMDSWESSSDGSIAPSQPSRAVGRSASRYATSSPAALLEAQAHYARGHQLEESDVSAARDAYLKALHVHSDHLEARINLGRLLHIHGELEEAEKVYRQAKTSSALLSFNLGILLEDLNRDDEAAVAYRDALAQDPSLHDAHYNLSQLHERAERPRDALRHLLAFRRHLLRYGDSA